MPKPADFPRWADAQITAGAETTEPAEATKDDGWINAEKPRAGYFNWWMNLVYQWIVDYVDVLESEDFTWTGTHVFDLLTTFGASISVTGDVTATGEVNAAELQTAQTSVQRAAGWHPIAMSAFIIDTINAAGSTYLFTTDELSTNSAAGAGVPVATAALTHLVVGDRVQKLSLTAYPTDASDNCVVRLKRKELATGTITNVTLASATVTGTAYATDTTAFDLAHTIADGYTYFLQLELSAGTHGGSFHGVRVQSDRPV